MNSKEMIFQIFLNAKIGLSFTILFILIIILYLDITLM